MIDQRMDTLNDRIKDYEDKLIDDFVKYLNGTFDLRVKKIQEEQDLEYFEVAIIKNWLRKNPDETMVISFVE